MGNGRGWSKFCARRLVACDVFTVQLLELHNTGCLALANNHLRDALFRTLCIGLRAEENPDMECGQSKGTFELICQLALSLAVHLQDPVCNAFNERTITLDEIHGFIILLLYDEKEGGINNVLTYSTNSRK